MIRGEYPGITVSAVLSRLAELIEELRELVRVAEAHEIARRMFVTNTLDGLLSTIGILLGAHLIGSRNPMVLYGAILGGNSAMGIFSAFLGTYLSERAERLRELRELERSMATDLRGSIYWKSARIVPLYVAFWSSLGILVFPATCSSPLLLARHGIIGLEEAIVYTLILIEAAMFLLGSYLGKISGEKWYKTGARMLVVGLAAILLYTLLKRL